MTVDLLEHSARKAGYVLKRWVFEMYADTYQQYFFKESTLEHLTEVVYKRMTILDPFFAKEAEAQHAQIYNLKKLTDNPYLNLLAKNQRQLQMLSKRVKFDAKVYFITAYSQEDIYLCETSLYSPKRENKIKNCVNAVYEKKFEAYQTDILRKARLLVRRDYRCQIDEHLWKMLRESNK